MHYIKYFILSLGLTVSALALSAENTVSSIPKNLHIYSFGGSTFVDHVATGCSGSRYYLPTDHYEYDAVLSILLAAQMGNKAVQLRFDGCNTQSQGKIIGVYLK